MSRPVKFTDISVFQPSTYHYMKQLKAYGSQFNFVKLTEGNTYLNASAASQISNSLAVWGSVGLYHFWHGESAAFFIREAHRFGMDFPTTKVALDVEATDLPYYCTSGVNEFESELVKAGFKPGNIWTYVSVAWLNAGRLVPSKLKYGFVWAAMYPYSNAYSDNSLSGYSRLNPGYNAWQFSGLGSQDWSYDYTRTLLTGQKSSSKPKRKPKAKPIIKKPVNHYLKSGKTFEVICNGLSGYTSPGLITKNGVYLSKGSKIHGQVIQSFRTVTRLDTPIGWFSTNTKYLKAVK